MDRHNNLSNYFRERVQDDLEDIEMSEDTEFYIVDLLSRPEQVDDELIGFDKPVVFVYKEATEGDISKFKELGDATLVNLTVFPERLEEKANEKRYYVNFGKLGYKKFRNLVDYSKDSVFQDIYTELVKYFEKIVNSIDIGEENG